MKVLLRSMSVFNHAGELDVDSGVLTVCSRESLGVSEDTPTHGMFFEGSGCVRALYCPDGSRAVLQLGKDKTELTPDLHACFGRSTAGGVLKSMIRRLNGEIARRTFQLKRGESIVLSVDYERPIIDPPLSRDPTPFVDEEHWDFFVWVGRLVNDPERMRTFIAAHRKGDV